jgi:hypothetical protein
MQNATSGWRFSWHQVIEIFRATSSLRVDSTAPNAIDSARAVGASCFQ